MGPRRLGLGLGIRLGLALLGIWMGLSVWLLRLSVLRALLFVSFRRIFRGLHRRLSAESVGLRRRAEYQPAAASQQWAKPQLWAEPQLRAESELWTCAQLAAAI